MFACSKCFQVARITAQLVFAGVVHLLTLGDRAIRKFVSYAMGVGADSTCYLKTAVAFPVGVATPRPAVIRPTPVDVLIEALTNRKIEHSERFVLPDISILAKSLIVAVAQSSSYCCVGAPFCGTAWLRCSGRSTATRRIAVAPLTALVRRAKTVTARSVLALGNLAHAPSRFREWPPVVSISKLSDSVVVSCTQSARQLRAVTSLDTTLPFHTSIIPCEVKHGV
jgi:hypothetical protein